MSKLLIVDDEVDVREFAANFFRKRQVEVITASSGEEALEITKTYKPKLILLDIKMPGIDGIETLRRLRQIDKETPVIMVTAKEPNEDSACQKCQELGIIDYVHKPLELDELERVVLSILQKV